MGFWILSLFRVLGILIIFIGVCKCQERSFVISGFTQPVKWITPYDWLYLRVEIPPSFSSFVLTFISNVEIGSGQTNKISRSNIPLVCFKDGSPPIPDISQSYLTSSLLNSFANISFVGSEDIGKDQCVPFQKNITIVLSNDQIYPGVWYLGFFNGLGPERTQSKMISRGHAYKFSTNMVIQGCPTSNAGGPNCNQTIDMVSCSQSLPNTGTFSLSTCENSLDLSCLNYGELKLYYLDVENIASHFTITATNFELNHTSSVNNSAALDGFSLMIYARYNVIPFSDIYDYSADIKHAPLIVNLPKIGRWYIAVQVVNQTTKSYYSSKVCFSFAWKINNCNNGNAGPNCTWNAHMLQRLPRKSPSSPFESFYLPMDKKVPADIDSKFSFDNDFPIDNLLSNSSSHNDTWTYFLFVIPRGAAGTNMHVQLTTDSKLSHEIYAKYSGIPSMDSWDYHANCTSSSNGSTIMALFDSRERKINFYILYAKEGIWCLGLKHSSPDQHKRLTMSINLEGCPKKCSSNGQCHYSTDESGSSFFSYCVCDRDHGGFDCSNVLVSRKGHIWQSIFLISSNAAAILPAFWTLRQKAFAEWVLFTSSGISSGLYHACDVGTWCVLSFRVLQFMDFWLSFMAVISTFIYMATISETSKRAIHTVVAIVTALLAVTGATRSANIVLVVIIGTVGLFVGWLLEFLTSYQFTFHTVDWNLYVTDSWRNIRRWFRNLVSTLNKRFHWPLVILGFAALAFAATCWKLENHQSYWVWHSMWHISIYTSSFLFLWSTSANNRSEVQPAVYELTRQDSLSRT